MTRRFYYTAPLVAVCLTALAGCVNPQPLRPWRNARLAAAPRFGAGARPAPRPRPTPPVKLTKEQIIEQKLAFARLAERQNDSLTARKVYMDVIKEAPQHQLPYHRLGVMEAKKCDFEQADGHFRKALSVGQPNAELLTDYGYSLYLQSRYAEAEPVLRDALRVDPDCKVASNILGTMFGEQGRIDESLAQYRVAVGEAKAQSNLAYVLAQRGEFEEAQKHYSRALTLDDKMRSTALAMLQVSKYVPQVDAIGATASKPTKPEGANGQSDRAEPAPIRVPQVAARQRRRPAVSRETAVAASIDQTASTDGPTRPPQPAPLAQRVEGRRVGISPQAAARMRAAVPAPSAAPSSTANRIVRNPSATGRPAQEANRRDTAPASPDSLEKSLGLIGTVPEHTGMSASTSAVGGSPEQRWTASEKGPSIQAAQHEPFSWRSIPTSPRVNTPPAASVTSEMGKTSNWSQANRMRSPPPETLRRQLPPPRGPSNPAAERLDGSNGPAGSSVVPTRFEQVSP